MPIATACPHCKALFRLPDDIAGKKVRCQKCQSTFVVPESDGTVTVVGTRLAGGRPSQLDKPAAPPEVAQAAADPDEAPPLPVPKAKGPPPLPSEDEIADEMPDDGDDVESGRRKRSRRRSDPDSDDDDDRPRNKARRKERAAKPTSKGFPVLTVVLAGVGILGCLVCAGGTAIWMGLRPLFATNQEIVFAANGVFERRAILSPFDQVEQFDPQWGPKRHRVYRAQLEKGKSYQIDMISPDMDSFLHIADDQNRIVARDDDAGGNLNARIVFQPKRTGQYKIHATSLNGNEMGNYTLIVRKQ